LLDAALRVSTLSADASSDPLVEFLSNVLCNSILVLKQHAFVLSEMQSVTVHKEYTSFAPSFLVFIYHLNVCCPRYSIVSVWIVMQIEIQKLVSRYIQPNAAASDILPFLSSSNGANGHMYV
jgi:hypothetical protein